MTMDYKSSGVDIEKGDALVSWLQDSDSAPAPHADKIISGIGGFASVFQMKFPEISDPCLVSATDGVGTKLKLAIALDDYSGLGQDLVAMCVNDLICTGARPLFFLDYFATGKLDLDQAQPFLKGLRQACHQAGCALMGGETAEMPGVYQGRDFDCAGFAVGIVDRKQMIDPSRVQEGDRVLGLSSSGFHSNGYSLLRKLFADDASLFGEALLKPTTLYTGPILSGLYEKSLPVHALAHITGGGISNIQRVLPKVSGDDSKTKNTGKGIRFRPWEFSPLVREVQNRSGLSRSEMLKTFNCGMGMMMIVSPDQVQPWLDHLKTQGQPALELGEVVDSEDNSLWLDGELL